MAIVVVRYRPRTEVRDDNQQLVEAVFDELGDDQPDGLRYATFRLDDGTFLHIAETSVEPNPLTTVSAFSRFQNGIVERCESGEEPRPQEATLVGSYRFLAEGFGAG